MELNKLSLFDICVCDDFTITILMLAYVDIAHCDIKLETKLTFRRKASSRIRANGKPAIFKRPYRVGLIFTTQKLFLFFGDFLFLISHIEDVKNIY